MKATPLVHAYIYLSAHLVLLFYHLYARFNDQFPHLRFNRFAKSARLLCVHAYAVWYGDRGWAEFRIRNKQIILNTFVYNGRLGHFFLRNTLGLTCTIAYREISLCCSVAHSATKSPVAQVCSMKALNDRSPIPPRYIEGYSPQSMWSNKSIAVLTVCISIGIKQGKMRRRNNYLAPASYDI